MDYPDLPVPLAKMELEDNLAHQDRSVKLANQELLDQQATTDHPDLPEMLVHVDRLVNLDLSVLLDLKDKVEISEPQVSEVPLEVKDPRVKPV